MNSLISKVTNDHGQQFKKICEAIINKSIKKYQITSPEEINWLTKLLEDQISQFMVELLKKQFIETLLKIPTVEVMHNNKTTHETFIANLKTIPQEQVCVALERARLRIKSQAEQDHIIYFGFDKMITCVGIVLRNETSREIAAAHLSQETELVSGLSAMLNEILLPTPQNNILTLDLFGGYGDKRDAGAFFISEIIIKNILLILTILCLLKGTSLNIRFKNVLADTHLYQQLQNEKKSEPALGCLFKRDGQIALFEHPTLGLLPYFTEFGNSLFLAGEAKRKYVWFELLRILKIPGNELIKIYDDSSPEQYFVFIKQCEKILKEYLVSELGACIYKANLSVTDNDEFILEQLRKLIDQWS